jgi:hypothetical protein
MPIAALLSYPAVFVAGGVSLTMAMVIWQRGRRQDWLAWVACNLALGVAFAALFVLSAGGQSGAAGASMRADWRHCFPPLTSPGELLKFLVISHTSETMAYPMGGAHGASVLTTLCCGIALVLLFRSRQFWLVALCLCPLALNFLAAALHAYPYGGHVRLALYMGPVICLLTGLGAAGCLAALARRVEFIPPFRRRWPVATPVVVALAVLAAIGMGAAARDLLKPYKETCWMRQRDFARWFWVDKALDAEVMCLRNDLGQCFYSPREGDDLASVYYCNQRIYSPRHGRKDPASLERLSPLRPLRCVRFRPASTTSEDEAGFQHWLSDTQSRFRLATMERHPMPFISKERQVDYLDSVEVYDLVPKDSTAIGTEAVANQSRTMLR